MKKTAILMPALLTAASFLSGGCASSLAAAIIRAARRARP